MHTKEKDTQHRDGSRILRENLWQSLELLDHIDISGEYTKESDSRELSKHDTVVDVKRRNNPDESESESKKTGERSSQGGWQEKGRASSSGRCDFIPASSRENNGCGRSTLTVGTTG